MELPRPFPLRYKCKLKLQNPEKVSVPDKYECCAVSADND